MHSFLRNKHTHKEEGKGFQHKGTPQLHSKCLHSWNLDILILAVGMLFLWKNIYVNFKEFSFSVYYIHAIMLMLGLWNLFLMRLGLCFQGFLALLWFLILILKALMFDPWIFIHKIKRCFWWKIAKTVENCLHLPFKNWKHAFFASCLLPKLLAKNAPIAQTFLRVSFTHETVAKVSFWILCFHYFALIPFLREELSHEILAKMPLKLSN